MILFLALLALRDPAVPPTLPTFPAALAAADSLADFPDFGFLNFGLDLGATEFPLVESTDVPDTDMGGTDDVERAEQVEMERASVKGCMDNEDWE